MVSTVPETVTVCVGSVLWSCAQLGTDRAKTNPTALRITFPRFMDLSPWNWFRVAKSLTDHVPSPVRVIFTRRFFAFPSGVSFGETGASPRSIEPTAGWDLHLPT